MLKAGGYLRRVTIQTRDETQDSVGQRVLTYTELTTRMAKINPVSGREYFNASGERANVSTEIRMRYDASLSVLHPDDRIVHGSVNYDIISIINMDERNRELVLMCERSA